MKKSKESQTEKLLQTIVEGIQNKKGKEIVIIDLRKIENSVCQYFVICHGDSNTQVKAIADEIDHFAEELWNEKVWHKEGLENAQWVLLDYVDIVVHVFQESYRRFYNLEQLWADAELKQIDYV